MSSGREECKRMLLKCISDSAGLIDVSFFSDRNKNAKSIVLKGWITSTSWRKKMFKNPHMKREGNRNYTMLNF